MTLKSLAIVSLAVIAATVGIYMLYEAPETDATYLKAFLDHKRRYNKTYTSKDTMKYRFEVFSQNMEFIRRHNSKISSFECGENQFTDMTFEEFKSKYLSQEPMLNEIKTANIGPEVKGSADWRVKGKVSQVKNQASCGSCWAFSSTGSLESAYAIFKDVSIEFSEQELVDCSRSYGNHGCMGGLMSYSFEYIKKNKIGKEQDYPYNGTDGICRAKKEGERYEVTGYSILSPIDVTGLSTALEKQPVSVAIEVQQDFMHYKSGVYVNDHCGTHLNHGVLVVGYDTEKEIPYFIIKNSWGTTWGDEGYILMKVGQGSGTCGIANNWDVYPQL